MSGATAMTSESGTFIWNELVTTDQAAAGDFYSRLLGWERHEVDAGPFGTYTLFRKDGRDVAGMMNPTASDYGSTSPVRWVAYIATDDADRVAAETARLGGRVIEPPRDVPGVGRICAVQDPTGAVAYFMQPELPPA